MNTELEQIVEGCKKKQPLAQKLLYEKFAPEMLGICMRYTHSRDEAQDLLHDGFIKVFESIGSLKKSSSVRSWMYKVMVNESLSYLTKLGPVNYMDFDTVDEEDEEIMAQTDYSPWEGKVFSMEQIVNAIQMLPDFYRMVFNLHEVEEMDYPEIAKQTGKSVSTVRSRYSRACKMLRNILLNYYKL